MAPTPAKTVLFVGTRNDSRSRIAEIVFNAVAGRMRLPWRAISRGLAADCGDGSREPIAPAAVHALKAMSLRAEADSARFPVRAEVPDLLAADWIVALDEGEHRPLLAERFPDAIDRVEFWQAPDFPQAAKEIEREVMDLAARLITGGRRRVAPPPLPEPTPQPAKAAPSRKLTAKVGRETAGRRGKGVTTVFDVSINENELAELAGLLKQKCGTGGTVKNGRIEIQGDQRDRITSELEKLGYKVKRSGG